MTSMEGDLQALGGPTFFCFIKTKNLLIYLLIYCNLLLSSNCNAPDFHLLCRFMTIFFNSFQINEWSVMLLSKP